MHIITGQAILAGEARKPATENQPANANIASAATDNRDPRAVQRLIDLLPAVARADFNGLLVLAENHITDAVHVDQDRIFPGTGPSAVGVVATAAHCKGDFESGDDSKRFGHLVLVCRQDDA